MTLRRPRLAALACAALVGCSTSGRDAAPSAAPPASPAPASPAPARPAPASPAPASSRPSDSAPASTAGQGVATTTYIALGDSVAAGVGATSPETEGYVPVLARLLSDRRPLSVRSLAVPGATTATLLREQLPVALGELSGDSAARLVTVTVGGNDVFVPVVQACGRSIQDPACRQAVRDSVEQVDAGVDELLQRLAAGAGPAATVAVMAYYDPLPACHLASLAPLAERVLEGTSGQPGLNDVLRARAAEHGALVVETVHRLRPPGDFVGGSDCLHPSSSGHRRIAQAFADAVGESVVGG